jgi:DNA-binding SARP family transcriptional activator
MDFRILGPVEVVDGKRAVELPGTKHRTLLAMLLVHANEVVSTERLIEALWEQERPPRAHKTLQVYVSQLRKALGADRVRTQAPGYLLRVEDDELDVARFQRLAGSGRLADALSLCAGRRSPSSRITGSRRARSPASRSSALPASSGGSTTTSTRAATASS